MVDIYLWLYHTDLWPEFCNVLNPIKDHIFLHLELCEENHNSHIADSATDSFPNLEISYHPNAGGDILPFLSDFVSNKHKNDLFIKLHSKKSTLLNTIQWRDILLHSLIGNNGQHFFNNCSYMRKFRYAGLMSNYGLMFSNQENTNTNKINELLNYFNIDKNLLKQKKFIAGTMFLGNTSIYNKFFNEYSINHITTLLRSEVGQVTDIINGKYCHSLERIFGYICEYEKHSIVSCKYHTIKIINNKAPSKKFHLSVTYNNFVFTEESIAVHGTMLHKTDDTFTIEWRHLKNPVIKKYIKINNNTFIGHE